MLLQRYENIEYLLLDMNSTFMFNEDRFGDSEDYSVYYKKAGGALPSEVVNRVIRRVYDYLGERYPDPVWRECFPSVEEAIIAVTDTPLSEAERKLIVDTFAFHECGDISQEYLDVLHRLGERFTLSVVIDIWAPSDLWLREFERYGIKNLFKAMSFSSDIGIVKPSPIPFLNVMRSLGCSSDNALVVGDSARRDLGGALAAGVPCVLVGGQRDDRAWGHYDTLIDFYEAVGIQDSS